MLCTDFHLRVRILEQAAEQYMHLHHAFFTFVMSPYVHHTEDSNALQSSKHERILESIFEIHPDFIQENNDVERVCSEGNVCTLEERFILDSLLLLDTVFSLVENKSDLADKPIFESLRNRTLDIFSGEIIVDTNNEIMYGFVVYDFDIANMKYVKIQEVVQSNEGMWKLLGIAEVQWPSGIKLPPDECFHPESCEVQEGMEFHMPRHDITNKVTVRPAKTQISLGIRPV